MFNQNLPPCNLKSSLLILPSGSKIVRTKAELSFLYEDPVFRAKRQKKRGDPGVLSKPEVTVSKITWSAASESMEYAFVFKINK